MEPDVLQLDGSVMERQINKSLEVRTATWNVSSMVRQSEEVVKYVHRIKVDFCCAQETR